MLEVAIRHYESLLHILRWELYFAQNFQWSQKTPVEIQEEIDATEKQIQLLQKEIQQKILSHNATIIWTSKRVLEVVSK